MIVNSDIPAPLVYTDPTYSSPALKVQTTIYDVSTGTPVIADTVELDLISNGVYFANYQFEAGKQYVVKTLVYTDGTFSVVDEDFPQVTDEVQCVQGNSGGGGSCQNSIKAIISQNSVKVMISRQPSIIVKVGC